MPTRNVVLTDHQAQSLEQLVTRGRYKSAGEVLRLPHDSIDLARHALPDDPSAH